MAQCSTTDLLNASKPFMGFGQKDLAQVVAALLCKILQAFNPVAQCDAKSLLQSACNSGISCLGERELWVVIAQLLCEILHSGGGSGNSCLLCGTVDPVAVPPCDCAIYYNTTAGSFWVWDSVSVSWFALIGP